MRALVFCLLLLTGSAQAEKVLLIQSYHAEFPWDVSYIKGIKDTISSSAQLHSFQMDTKRIPVEQFETKANEAFEYYNELKPSVVILGDDNALKYMLPKLYQEPISIVFLGINSNPRALLRKYKGQAKVTGVLELPLFVKNIRDLSQMLPKQKHKFRIMFDSGITSKEAAKHIKKQYELIERNLKVEADILLIGTKEEWQRKISSAQDDGISLIIIGLYQTLVDKSGNSVPASEILAWTNKNSKTPLFAFWDFAVGEGKTSGGVVLFGESQGKQAAGLVNEILAGADANSLPIGIGEQGRAIYSEKEMQRWGLTPPSHWSVMN
ncbi:ABC transporter substrate-binding protein [Vibrio tetraodonis]|uniref:ABC transporter substrate-binding protein n=1 Tax=Vibrio tetraodonis TaxID=2231647 RepID=UPI000E0A1656|nr:ABC transporter substrate binding protein [Vibrio tetraodonis]